jgi:2-polyprenyl-3-methyl-5-hydroxy-6-metoxy-1,4-benzoquinol methylase
MNSNLTPATLSAWLHTHSSARKTYLRPYICPFHTLLAHVPEGASLYDVGCGGGAWLALANHYRHCNHLGGYDVAEGPVSAARDLLAATAPASHTELTVSPGVELPALISAFEVVSVIDVFHHIPLSQQSHFITELFTRMRPGARLIFKDIDRDHPFVFANKLHDRILSGATGHEWGRTAARAALENAGFTIQAAETHRMVVYPHYWFVAQKPQPA